MTELQRPIAVIDVGSNSVFLMVVQPMPDGTMRLLARQKVRARLGAAVAEHGAFSVSVIEELIGVLRGFGETARHWNAELVATATAALRRAANGRALLEQIHSSTGVELRLIGGDEEAHIAFSGARYGGAAMGRPMLCVDVGGGSTELGWGVGETPTRTASAPLGAVTLTYKWLADERVSVEQLAAVRGHIHKQLGPEVSSFQGLQAVAVATSGTILRIARMLRSEADPSQDVNGVHVTGQQLSEVVNDLVACHSHEQRRQLTGMDPERADVLLAGALIFESLSQLLSISRWEVSSAGLRMGLVAQVVRQRAHRAI